MLRGRSVTKTDIKSQPLELRKWDDIEEETNEKIRLWEQNTL